VNPVTANWSKKELDSAGKILVLGAHRVDDPAVITAYQVLSVWRIAHEKPLSGAMGVLRRYANQNGWNAIVSGRTKRFPSIIAKLVRYTTLKLSAMQDIGGCRIVLDDIDQAELLASHVKHGLMKGFGSDHISQPDHYIEKPKADGYRSIHFVLHRQPKDATAQERALKIEIQIRSLLQHRWATAVETVDLFTRQSLKSGGGDSRWRRFFALTASIFALRENRPIVPDTPAELAELEDELSSLARDLHIGESLRNWSDVMRDIGEGVLPREHNAHYLVKLDVTSKTTEVDYFDQDRLREAHDSYTRAERESANFPGRSVVLVSANSLTEVRNAYPAFHGDTRAFLRELGLLQS
jgi:hypothetical protein